MAPVYKPVSGLKLKTRQVGKMWKEDTTNTTDKSEYSKYVKSVMGKRDTEKERQQRHRKWIENSH